MPLRKQAVPAIVPTLIVAYCLHLPLVEVHVTTSCLVLIVQLRVHATYLSSSFTAMSYELMEAVFVVVEGSLIPLWPCLLSGVTIATCLSARCNLANLLLSESCNAECAWHMTVAACAADEMCFNKILSRTVNCL